jgi:hypothetical protein
MAKKDSSPTPEEVGKAFRIPKLRGAGAPLGKPETIDDVIRRSAARAPQRQQVLRKPPRDTGDA